MAAPITGRREVGCSEIQSPWVSFLYSRCKNLRGCSCCKLKPASASMKDRLLKSCFLVPARIFSVTLDFSMNRCLPQQMVFWMLGLLRVQPSLMLILAPRSGESKGCECYLLGKREKSTHWFSAQSSRAGGQADCSAHCRASSGHLPVENTCSHIQPQVMTD